MKQLWSGRRGRRLVPGALLMGALTFTGLPPAQAASPSCTSAHEFDFTGHTQCFVVPQGVSSVTFAVYGAQGGNGGNNGAIGGKGAEVVGTVPNVHAGQTFDINVGGAGSNGVSATGGGSANVSGGWPGGGMGGGSNGTVTTSGGGGGGYSSIIFHPLPTAFYTVLMAAGGGGGGGWGGSVSHPGNGGDGGGVGAGEGAPDCGVAGGSGGTPGLGGRAGGYSSGGFYTECPGGGGGMAGPGQDGDSGSTADSDQGGTGGCLYVDCVGVDGNLGYTGGGGGGGGAGNYGGGGGAPGSHFLGTDSGAGGGGGSSYISPTTSQTAGYPGVQTGNGKVVVSFDVVNPVIKQISPRSAARGSVVTLTITGAGLTSANAVYLLSTTDQGQGVTQDIQVLSANQIQATIATSGLLPGEYDVVVQTNGCPAADPSSLCSVDTPTSGADRFTLQP